MDQPMSSVELHICSVAAGVIHPSRASLPASTSGPISLLTRPVVPSNLCSLSPRVSAASAHT